MFNHQIVKKPAKKKKSHQKFEPSITKDTLKCREKRGHEAKQNQGFYFFLRIHKPVQTVHIAKRQH